MAETISAYMMRVDEMSGIVYRGYFSPIENTLDAEQRYVNYGRGGGRIQVIHLTDEIDLIANDEGKLLGFPLNRMWLDEDGKTLDFIMGDILAVRHEGERLASIRESDMGIIEERLKVMKIVGFLDMEFVDPEYLPEYREAKGE